MIARSLKLYLVILLFFNLGWGFLSTHPNAISLPTKGVCFAQGASGTSEDLSKSDIQWFREEMKISPKYMEQDEGILGMSWTHFFTMVFLIFISIVAIIQFFIRHRRTKQLLNQFLKEEEENGADR